MRMIAIQENRGERTRGRFTASGMALRAVDFVAVETATYKSLFVQITNRIQSK
jgi:hypothetical protein